jgi:hypothetical protein
MKLELFKVVRPEQLSASIPPSLWPHTKQRLQCQTCMPGLPKDSHYPITHVVSKSISTSGTRHTLGLLSGHASNLHDTNDVLDVFGLPDAASL